MEQITVNEDYEVLKMELKATLDEITDNFIVTGYILKQVRDRNLYLHENYRDIYDFGMREYGLSRATVSRFMNINTKFSVGGNSREISPEYKGYGRSKIQEMLNVDEGDMELITADTTVDQVKELKKAEEEQRRIEKEERENNLPLIRMAAGNDKDSAAPEQGPESMEPFDAVMAAFWEENRELYHKVSAGLITPEIIAEEICPSGSRTYRKGVNMMFFYEFDRGLKLRSYEKGTAAITAYTYQELIEKTNKLNITQRRLSEKEESQETPELSSEQPEKPVATPQHEQEDWEAPYVPVPGQTSVSDLQGVVPETIQETVTSSEENRDNVAETENVIDGEYRELHEQTKQENTKEKEECPYADIEIKNAINFFDMEYFRMVGLGQDAVKRRNYKIARECIRKCYKSIAKQVDNCLPG